MWKLPQLYLLSCLFTTALATPLSLLKREMTLDSTLYFQPPNLIIDDATGMAIFNVSLQNPPTDNNQVEVQFKAANLMFSSCRTFFNRTNYNIPITVHVWPKPTYVDASKSIKDDNSGLNSNAPRSNPVFDETPIEVNILGSNFLNSTKQYNVSRNVVPAAYCGVSGDPHFFTFDGAQISSGDIGTHYYVKSDYLVIQGQHVVCTPLTTDPNDPTKLIGMGATCLQCMYFIITFPILFPLIFFFFFRSFFFFFFFF